MDNNNQSQNKISQIQNGSPKKAGISVKTNLEKNIKITIVKQNTVDISSQKV